MNKYRVYLSHPYTHVYEIDIEAESKEQLIDEFPEVYMEPTIISIDKI